MVLFFFKHKTAYEMRISDWSSDVCSSDLYCILVTNNGSGTATGIAIADPLPAGTSFVPGSLRSGASCAGAATAEDDNASGADENDRSEERRVGKERGRTCRSRRTQYN